MCIYIDFFLVVAFGRQLPNEQQIHSSAFLVLSLTLCLCLCLSLNYQKTGSTVNQFSGIIATTDVRDFSTTTKKKREKKRNCNNHKSRQAKSENKTCHKINKARRGGLRRSKRQQKQKQLQMKNALTNLQRTLTQCAIKVHAPSLAL